MQRNSHKILRPWPETLRVECNIASRHDFADIVRWCLHEKAGISDIFVAVVDNPDLLRKLSRDGEYELRAAVFPCAVAHAYQLIADSPTPEIGGPRVRPHLAVRTRRPRADAGRDVQLERRPLAEDRAVPLPPVGTGGIRPPGPVVERIPRRAEKENP